MSTALTVPPPMLECARVIAYAYVAASIPFLGKTQLYNDGVLIERVASLAICENLGADVGPLLFHCDEEWNVLGTSGAQTVEATMLHAERNYPGLMEHWVWLNTTVEAAIAYYDSISAVRCAFCGKRSYEISGFVDGKTACICRGCVESFHKRFNSPDADDTLEPT